MLKLAIIGQEGHYNYSLEGLKSRDDLKLCAIAPGSPSECIDTLKQRTEQYDPRVYADYREMLSVEKPDIAVINPVFHKIAPITMDCLESGAHAFSEKPLATTLDDLDNLMACFSRCGKKLCGMFGIKEEPWFIALKQAVMDGEIGEVRLIHGQKSYKLGTRPEFYSHRELFGGIIPWVAIHAVDWALELGGHCHSVTASHSSKCNSGNGSLEVSSAALMELDNGVIATITADYLRPAGAARHDDDRLRVTGTRGMLEAINGRVYLENEQARRELDLPERDVYFNHFVDAIIAGNGDELAAEAFEATRVCLLARQAADECTRIKL